MGPARGFRKKRKFSRGKQGEVKRGKSHHGSRERKENPTNRRRGDLRRKEGGN